jgi:hypothetical protein
LYCIWSAEVGEAKLLVFPGAGEFCRFTPGGSVFGNPCFGVFPFVSVYRTHMQQLFAPFWTEIQKREAFLRVSGYQLSWRRGTRLTCVCCVQSVPYHFAEWNRESIFTIAYWQLSQPLKDVRHSAPIVSFHCDCDVVSLVLAGSHSVQRRRCYRICILAG